MVHHIATLGYVSYHIAVLGYIPIAWVMRGVG